MPPPRHTHLIYMDKQQMYLFGGLDELGAQSFAMWVTSHAGSCMGACIANKGWLEVSVSSAWSCGVLRSMCLGPEFKIVACLGPHREP